MLFFAYKTNWISASISLTALILICSSCGKYLLIFSLFSFIIFIVIQVLSYKFFCQHNIIQLESLFLYRNVSHQLQHYTERKYNERTLLTFVNIIDKIKNDSTYQLGDDIKKKFLDLYENIICGEEKRYIVGDEKYVKIQNNFSCRVDLSIFKTLCKIYGKNIFDRISLEKIYYFQNIVTGDSVKIRTSKILDNIE